jgi:hypothetical protein
MTLPVIDVQIRPDSTFIVSGTGILGTSVLGASFLLGPPAAALVSIVGQSMDVSIHRGRTRATDSFDTGNATVTFLDTTGQFNPDNTSSSLYPYVLPLRQFRISATVGSTVYQLFNGYTTKYTYQFEPGVDAVFVTIEAEDAFRVLSMSSVVEIPSATYAEYSGPRITKILNQLNVPTSIRSISTGATQVDDDFGTVRTGLEALQQVEEAELGAYFIDKKGFHTFRGRQDLQLLAGGVTKTPIVFDESAGLPYNAVQVAYDDEQIINYVTVDGSSLNGAEAFDSPSIENYFNRTLNKTNSLLTTDAEATSQANYLLGFRKDPKVTIDSIDFNVSGLDTETRTNLITNPSFETNTTGWASAQSPIVVSPIVGFAGTNSLLVRLSSIDTNMVYTVPTASSVGTYVFSMYCYTPIGSPFAGRTISVNTEGGSATVSAVSQSSATLVAGSWVRFSTTKNVTVAGTIVLVSRLSGSLQAFAPRTNLISNPSFETNVLGWNANGSTNTRVAGTWGMGSFVYRIVATGTGNSGTFTSVNAFPVTPGGSYTVSFFAKSISGTLRKLYIGIYFSDASGGFINQFFTGKFLTTGVQRFSITATAPALAATGGIFAYTLDGGTTSDTFEMDSVLVEQSSELNSYFDGTRPGATWTGAVNNSTSILPRTNLILNPSFESDVANWNTTSSSCTNTRTAGTIAGGSGSWSMVSVATVTTQYGPSCGGTGVFPISEGATYTFSAQVLRLVGSRTYSARIDWYDSGGVFISLANSSANACATSTRLSITGTAPAGAVRADLRLISTNTGALGDSHQIDAVMFEDSSTLNPYFDGSTNSDTSWTGIVNNSTSIQNQTLHFDAGMFEQTNNVSTYFDGATSSRGFTSWTGTAHGSTSVMLSDAESVVNAELLDPVTITKNYANGTISRTLTVQGITHSITPGNWEMSLELAEPVGGDGLVLDSPNAGILDNNILVY